ncbi:MAG: hypothetical protein HOK24_24060 [Desulfobacula sp.]|uniref:hypothetical protein n=1 Tax=Desulfobacula sp. TaxID=2593537 RepID=UPI001D21AD79|nr:hypothetical protein [Desulfobacula sp.]MBT4201471.1 hypothetical protein [Desulfobacula sp.]MBT4509021.1 hypothetical protein [Desulfobacula sp.]MBT5547514.1 hypothetical protein [Desulfobacula sp.]MBT5969521.1 hypothetical protein [Desulfobacula sp.]
MTLPLLIQTDNESKEKPAAQVTANDRLKILYKEFNDANIQYKIIFVIVQPVKKNYPQSPV